MDNKSENRKDCNTTAGGRGGSSSCAASRGSKRSVLTKRIHANYTALRRALSLKKQLKRVVSVTPSPQGTKDSDCPVDNILMVERRQAIATVGPSDGKADDRIHSLECDELRTEVDSLKDLSFMEGAHEGLKMAFQDIYNNLPITMCKHSSTNDIVSSSDTNLDRRGTSLSDNNSNTLREGAAPLGSGQCNTALKTKDYLDKDVHFLEGAQQGLKLAYNDVSSDIVSFFHER